MGRLKILSVMCTLEPRMLRKQQLQLAKSSSRGLAAPTPALLPLSQQAACECMRCVNVYMLYSMIMLVSYMQS